MTTPADAPLRPDADPSWTAYPHTVLELHGAHAAHGTRIVRLDLRAPLGSRDREALEAIGFGEPFAVVTAWNPRGSVEVDTTGAANRARDARLRATLDGAGLRWVRADGVSPSGPHREEGVAVVMPCADAEALARAFEQSAFFWFDGRAVWLMPALVDAPPRALGADRAAR